MKIWSNATRAHQQCARRMQRPEDWSFFALQLAQEMRTACQDAHSTTVLACTSALFEFYVLMGTDNCDAHLAKEACLKCCVQYAALSKDAVALGPPCCGSRNLSCTSSRSWQNINANSWVILRVFGATRMRTSSGGLRRSRPPAEVRK